MMATKFMKLKEIIATDVLVSLVAYYPCRMSSLAAHTAEIRADIAILAPVGVLKCQ